MGFRNCNLLFKCRELWTYSFNHSSKLPRETYVLIKFFLNPKYTLSIIVLITAIFGMYSVMTPIPLFLQNILGMTPLKTGLLMLPGTLLLALNNAN